MHTRAGITCALAVLLGAQLALPHNEQIHQNMIDLAYQSMVWSQRFEGGGAFNRAAPPGWTDFQNRIAVAVSKLRGRNSALSEMTAPQSLSCPDAIYDVKDLPVKWWDKPLGEVPFPPAIDFANNGGGGGCGDWERGGKILNPGAPGKN